MQKVFLFVTVTSLLGLVALGQPSDPEPCNIDYVCFGYDSSGSVDPTEFEQQALAMKEIAAGLDMTGAEFAAYSMVNRASGSLTPTEDAIEAVAPFASNAEFQAADIVRATGPFSNSFDDISSTIIACGDALNSVSGVRVMILLTDGYSPPYGQLPVFQGHIDLARSYSDISVFTVGTGVNPNAELLELVASSPLLYEPATNFEVIAEKVLDLLRDPDVCDEIDSSPTPSPTPKPFRCRRNACRFRLNASGAILARGGSPRVGIVGGGGEALVRDGTATVPISQWDPAGLRQSFSPSFFKPFPLAGTFMSGVGFEVPQQNQGNYLDGLRVCLPLRAYQVLSEGNSPQVIDNVNTNDPADCVFFKSVFPEMSDSATQS